MAVFFEIGGDIYAGPTKQACIEALMEDVGEEVDEDALTELPGSTQMAATDENDEPTGELIALEDEYNESMGAYCIASNNL